MNKTPMNNLRDFFGWGTDSWDKNIPVYLRVDFDKFQFEDSLHYFQSSMVISKNDLEGQQSHNVQEVHM